MKGFMHWFKSNNKMKRWMFLILLGIILACYGFSEILVKKEMTFGEVGKIITIFAVGFVGIVVGLVFLNKRTLEVLIESTDERMVNKSNINVNSLIFNKNVYDRGPKIVVIGGGTGLNTVLSGLKNYTSNLTAIVAVSDYGEEAEESRKELGIGPLEDIKASIISLSTKQKQLERLMKYKFKEGRLKGLEFSDLYFSAMQDITGNFEDSIMKSNEIFNMIGNVLPVTLDEMKIVAELANGYVVEEKSRIPEVVSEKITKINRVMLNPTNCKATPGVIKTIKEADCIVIGPGSLYTNVIPNLLVNGVARAIKESAAIKVYISNIMTEPGQTDDYSVADHIKAIIEHCGTGIVDYCIYDTGEVVPEYIKKYNLEGQSLVDQTIEKIKGVKFLQRNLSTIRRNFIRHDPSLVAESIIELICDDLKYQDKEHDPEYLMLNTKLREEKRINKVKKQMAKREEQKAKGKKVEKTKKGKSKFSIKYSDRIESIKESDRKAKQRIGNEVRRKKIPRNRQEINRRIQENIAQNGKMLRERETEIKQRPKSARGQRRKINK